MWNGFDWAEWTSHNWQIPITSCIVYLVGIVVLNRWMRDRKAIRLQSIVLAWNFGLSAFSFAGARPPLPPRGSRPAQLRRA